jgi:putative oxidoreductase
MVMEDTLSRHWPLPLRILLGIGFLVHGLPKLGAPGHASFANMLQGMGFPVADLLAWFVGLLEVFGGVALLVGFATSVFATLLAIEMVVAALMVHLPAGFNAMNIRGMSDQGPVFGPPGMEFPLLYLAGLLALLLGGPGPLSVDERVLRPESRLRRPWRHREVHA